MTCVDILKRSLRTGNLDLRSSSLLMTTSESITTDKTLNDAPSLYLKFDINVNKANIRYSSSGRFELVPPF